MGFELEQDHKNIYINRLMRNGYSLADAYNTYHEFLREYNFSHMELEDYLTSIERMRRRAICG